VNNKLRNSNEENVKKALNASQKRIENDHKVRREYEIKISKHKNFSFLRNLIYLIIVYVQLESFFVPIKQLKKINVCY
jgi:hypothetical protein